MTRILVTGGGGFIGSAVRRVSDADIVNFDHPADIRDADAVDQAVAHVDAVINLAGILGTEETLGHETESVAVNILGALNVADACERHDVPLVQIGTGHRGQPNVYAITKACAEDLILARVRWGGLQANVVRAFHAYGPGQKAPPPYGKATVRKIIPAFVCAALAGDPLIVNGTGMQTIDLVHVDEVARVLLDGLSGPFGQTIEAGTGTPITVFQAAKDVIAACGSSSEIVLTSMRQGEPLMSSVYATHPACVNHWPDLGDTIDHYRGL
jgi:UDP-glucose 4-epimerase